MSKKVGDRQFRIENYCFELLTFLRMHLRLYIIVLAIVVLLPLFLFAGDRLKPGTSMFDVETDKSVVTADSTEDGYLAKILVLFC
jgi:hypothetical protein